MKTTIFSLKVLIGLAAFALFPTHQTHGKAISLSEVPKRVLDAAKGAVPQFEALTAEREWEWGRIVFEVSGVSGTDGFFYEVEVSTKGKILEIEKRAREEEEEGDDEDDDDEEDA